MDFLSFDVGTKKFGYAAFSNGELIDSMQLPVSSNVSIVSAVIESTDRLPKWDHAVVEEQFRNHKCLVAQGMIMGALYATSKVRGVYCVKPKTWQATVFKGYRQSGEETAECYMRYAQENYGSEFGEDESAAICQGVHWMSYVEEMRKKGIMV